MMEEDIFVVPGLSEPALVGGIRKFPLDMEPSMLFSPTDKQ